MISYTKEGHIMNIEDLPNTEGKAKGPKVAISFSENNATSIHPHNKDHMVITVICDKWEIKGVLVD